MKSRKTIGEIFQEISKARVKKERLEILKMYDSPQIRQVIKMNFDETIQFDLPQGEVPYRRLKVPLNIPEAGDANLWLEIKKMYLYIKGGHKTLTPFKRQQLFIQLLEALHPIEADLLMKLKDKKLKCGLTRSVIDEAYPGLLPLLEKKVKGKNASDENSSEDS